VRAFSAPRDEGGGDLSANSVNRRSCAASIRNFEIPPKIEILVFFKNKKILLVEEAVEHVFTFRIFNPRTFHMLFLLSKNGLCM
jgi:hypothetical protein